MLYSIRWEKVVPVFNKKSYEPHIIQVKTTFLDESGQINQVTRKYEEWIGVCTNHIDKVVESIRENFPNCPVRHVSLGSTRKILPYFESRLHSGKLDSPTKPFYKVFVKNVSVADVGRLLSKYKLSYYEKDDWLVRLYIDLCFKYNSTGFFYKWYTVSHQSEWLLESFQMHPEQTQSPDWTIGAFDLETVPMDGTDHIPNGMDPSDEIVMISLYKWNKRDGVRKWLLYRLPCEMEGLSMEDTIAYTSERHMLNDFHVFIQDCHVLTGYNITGFDIPCVFARLLWLKMYKILKLYTSQLVGTTTVATFQNKLVLDLYQYFLVFSKYDLPGLKLDDVARAKLGETKVPIHSTGLWSWYTHPNVTPSLVLSNQAEECFKILQPRRLLQHQFGTFKDYVRYCLKDSFLVYKLFTKEMVLSFLVERANFTAWDAGRALYMGNSSFLLELFKTYGSRLGYFFNSKFMKSPIDPKKYNALMVTNAKTYQGALNYCIPQTAYEDVAEMDFVSMYPSALLNCNLCYSTCTILTREEWLASPNTQTMLAIPYKIHGDEDFEKNVNVEHFRYPSYESESFVMVINPHTKGFLPCIVKHFINLRKSHQRQYKETKDIYHHNVQLCIKILINSLYGIMGNKQSCLSYLPIAMIIVTLARYQLLGSYHYCKRLGYRVCYADTDSLMVEKWPHDHCESINAFLNLPHVELKYEKRIKRLLVLSRKRYIYESVQGQVVAKCFQKRVNELVEFMTALVLENVWNFIYSTRSTPMAIQDVPENAVSNAWLEEGLSLESRGWLLWVELIQKACYKCRDPTKYSIIKKTKHVSEYKSQNCAAYRMLERYPEKANDYIEYTYSRADVSEKHCRSFIMDARECKWVDYAQMFINTKKTFCILLNMAFWKRSKTPIEECDMVMNTLKWKQLMHAELLYWHARKQNIVMLVEKGIKYTFSVNNHVVDKKVRITRKLQPDEWDDGPTTSHPSKNTLPIKNKILEKKQSATLSKKSKCESKRSATPKKKRALEASATPKEKRKCEKSESTAPKKKKKYPMDSTKATVKHANSESSKKDK